VPIQFAVAPGTILLCDYSGGFQLPEMVKRRPAIVVSPRLPRRDGLCAVVPLSTSPPEHELGYVVRLELPVSLPEPFDEQVMWAKCDMLATVGFLRLDLFRGPRLQGGKRQYIHPKLSNDDMRRVRAGMLHALGLSSLTDALT
jgi:mRNA interferase MazF